MSNEINNPELGAIYTTKILGVLLENWPRKVFLSCSEITGVEFDEDSIFDKPCPKEWEICSDLIIWLQKEGFIRSDGVRGSIYDFSSAEITMIAMTALNQVPDPLTPGSGRTLRDTLKDIAKNGSGKLADKVIDQAFLALTMLLDKG
ncbi:hypothetical protein NMS91_003456 [Vibrio cholerae]|nr:hypothetical protein [Vibrio cholerae]